MHAQYRVHGGCPPRLAELGARSAMLEAASAPEGAPAEDGPSIWDGSVTESPHSPPALCRRHRAWQEARKTLLIHHPFPAHPRLLTLASHEQQLVR